MQYLTDTVRIRTLHLPRVPLPIHRVESLNAEGTWEVEMVDTEHSHVEQYAHRFARLALASI